MGLGEWGRFWGLAEKLVVTGGEEVGESRLGVQALACGGDSGY
jgi:hypothetical protein